MHFRNQLRRIKQVDSCANPRMGRLGRHSQALAFEVLYVLSTCVLKGLEVLNYAETPFAGTLFADTSNTVCVLSYKDGKY